MSRLDPATFRLPVEKIRDGYYSDAYFNQTKALLEETGKHPKVLMQVFQREQSICGGIDEAIAVLKQCAGYHREPVAGELRDARPWQPGWDDLTVHALPEGAEIEPWETVMTIEGDYSLFAHLETVYLGTLARRSLVMRNVREVCDAADGKPIMFFPARHDHWQVQTGDGYAAHVAGAVGVSTDAQASWWGGKGIGTVPHALISAYGGDTVAAAKAFADRYADEMNVTVLVDFENDSTRTAVEVADALGDKLWGVRLDTSGSLVDKCLQEDDEQVGDNLPLNALRGVNRALVHNVRAALDEAGHEGVKIAVSGGFTAKKIALFEKSRTPVDAYGVGSSLIRGSNDYTADIVVTDGEPSAKVGRGLKPNPRLERVQ